MPSTSPGRRTPSSSWPRRPRAPRLVSGHGARGSATREMTPHPLPPIPGPDPAPSRPRPRAAVAHAGPAAAAAGSQSAADLSEARLADARRRRSTTPRSPPSTARCSPASRTRPAAASRSRAPSWSRSRRPTFALSKLVVHEKVETWLRQPFVEELPEGQAPARPAAALRGRRAARLHALHGRLERARPRRAAPALAAGGPHA